MQTVKGASEISGRTESRFVMQIVRVFCRMGWFMPINLESFQSWLLLGCHALALNLVKTWSFDQPSLAIPIPPPLEETKAPLSPIPTTPRTSSRPAFAFEHIRRRRSSILIDMDLPSQPPTQPSSPTADLMKTTIPEVPEPDTDPRQTGLGSLMKSARKDLKVPEFDMDSFFTPVSTTPAEVEPIPPTVGANEKQPTKPASGLGTFMKAAKDVQVPEFNMDSFF